MRLRGARLPFSEYQAIDAVNMSSLLGMLISPKEYQWRKTHPRQDTPAYRLGRLVHAAVLEPMRLLKDYAVCPYADFKKKAAQDWRDDQEAAGKTVISQTQFKAAEAMQNAVWNHKLAKRHILEGEPEATFTWTDARTGLDCKGRIDLLNGCTVDLKSTRHPSPRGFGNDAARFYYHARMAFYVDGIRSALGEERPVVLIAIQNSGPWDVAVYQMTPEQLENGRKTYERLLDELRMCLDADEWPGVCESEELSLELPAWAVPPDDEPITLDGEALF